MADIKEHMTTGDIALVLNDHEHEIGSLKHRVTSLEEVAKAIHKLAYSVDALAKDMERMLDQLKEQSDKQKEQEKRIDAIEKVPAEEAKEAIKYYKRLAVGYLLSGVIGYILGLIFNLLSKS